MGSNAVSPSQWAGLGSCLNVRWALTNGSSAYDLASVIAATSITRLAFLLVAQLLPKAAASRFISADMTINGLMAKAAT